MSKVLVIFDRNWADEFDVHGWYVDDKSTFESEIAALRECSSTNGFWFGTNEGWEKHDWDNTGSDWAKSFTSQDITDEEAETLNRLFGGSFGTIPCISELIESENEEEDEEL